MNTGDSAIAQLYPWSLLSFSVYNGKASLSAYTGDAADTGIILEMET